MPKKRPESGSLLVERVQTGVRIEKRLLKVLKALAEYYEISLGDLIEGIVMHAFEGKSPFNAEMQQRIGDFKRLYNLDIDAASSHHFVERDRLKKAPARSK